jgi:ureidoglycolate hydrolase
MELTINELINRLNTAGESVSFNDVMQVISDNYEYSSSTFINAQLVNQAGTNEGSCKIFAFAKLHNLSEQATLNCFGQYYREDVIKHPSGDDHGNIRSFINNGWQGITFENNVLKAK